MYKSELEVKNTKQLLEIAKERQIVGRHSMKKEQLIEDILEQKMSEKVEFKKDLEVELAREVSSEWETKNRSAGCVRVGAKPKKFYIDNARVGIIVAFKMDMSKEKAFSGKIKEIHEESFVIETKNGIRYRISKQNVIWVKTSDRWPNGILAALKGEKRIVKVG